MSGIFSQYPSIGGSGGGGGLSSISFSIGAFDGGTLNQNGASVSSNSIFLQSAGPTFPGLVNSTSQTFSGPKAFQSIVSFQQPVSIGSGFSQALLTISSNTAFQVPPANTNVHIIGPDGNTSRLTIDTYSTTLGNGPAILFRHARGTGASPSAVQLDDTLGFIGAFGYGTSAYGAATGGTFAFKAAQGFTGSNQGMYCRMTLNQNSTTTALERFRLSDAGLITLSGYQNSNGFFTTGSGGLFITSSVSLTSQVVGVLPAANIGSTTGTPYTVGAFNGAPANVNGGTIASSSLFLQSASTTNPGLVAVASTQSFTGLKSFTQVGINNTSGNAGLFVVASGLATNTLTLQGLSGQTSLGLNIIDSASNPKVVYDYNAGAFRLFVNAQEAAECNFDNRATVVTGAISTASAARFNFICADQSAVAANRGGGIAFGATVTGTTTVTEYGYIWATKNNANAGDDDGSMHFATRSNATGKAQRALDMDQAGNSTFFGNVQMAGSLNGQLNISAGSSVATYTIVLPSSQGSGSFSLLNNDGAGNLSWLQAKAPTRQLLGNVTWTAPVGCTAIKVTCVGGGGGGGGTASGATQGGAGGGGGGGGTVIGYFYGLSSAAVIVGAGGPGGASGNNAGQAGSASTFSTISASGGSGGSGSISAVGPTAGGGGGAGGTGSGGDSIIPGSQGGTGIILAGTASVISGAGGGSMYGAGINGQTNNTAAGSAQTTGAGGGGSGGLQINNGGAQVGGAGRIGVVIIEEYY